MADVLLENGDEDDSYQVSILGHDCKTLNVDEDVQTFINK